MMVAMLTAGALSACAPVTLTAGTEIPIETREPLSSKTDVKGRIVAMAVVSDVLVDGQVVLPKGTPVTGQIADAQATGGFGTSGRLMVRPVYLQIGGKTVRLRGTAGEKRGVSAGGVVGLLTLSGAISGRSALIPAGTRIQGEIERDAVIVRPCATQP
jgi:hypothetical protein